MSEKSSNFAAANVWAFNNRTKVKKFGYRIVLTAAVMLLSVFVARAEQLPYTCDIGAQGGIGYYIGDAQHHLFLYLREVYGGQFRYKFNNRWALQVKGQYQKLDFKVDNPLSSLHGSELKNDMVNVDVVGEFNFFRYGERTLDTRIKPITPYIFLGLGFALSQDYDDPYALFSMYLPLGLGMKWRFAPRWQLIVTWQHNIYFGDRLENQDDLGNTYDMNGTNIFNNDLTGQLTAGIVFEFAQKKGDCKHCSWH